MNNFIKTLCLTTALIGISLAMDEQGSRYSSAIRKKLQGEPIDLSKIKELPPAEKLTRLAIEMIIESLRLQEISKTQEVNAEDALNAGQNIFAGLIGDNCKKPVSINEELSIEDEASKLFDEVVDDETKIKEVLEKGKTEALKINNQKIAYGFEEAIEVLCNSKESDNLIEKKTKAIGSVSFIANTPPNNWFYDIYFENIFKDIPCQGFFRRILNTNDELINDIRNCYHDPNQEVEKYAYLAAMLLREKCGDFYDLKREYFNSNYALKIFEGFNSTEHFERSLEHKDINEELLENVLKYFTWNRITGTDGTIFEFGPKTFFKDEGRLAYILKTSNDKETILNELYKTINDIPKIGYSNSLYLHIPYICKKAELEAIEIRTFVDKFFTNKYHHHNRGLILEDFSIKKIIKDLYPYIDLKEFKVFSDEYIVETATKNTDPGLTQAAREEIRRNRQWLISLIPAQEHHDNSWRGASSTENIMATDYINGIAYLKCIYHPEEKKEFYEEQMNKAFEEFKKTSNHQNDQKEAIDKQLKRHEVIELTPYIVESLSDNNSDKQKENFAFFFEKMRDCAMGNTTDEKNPAKEWKQSCTPLSHVCNGLSQKLTWMKFFVEASDESATLATLKEGPEKQNFEKLIEAKRIIRSAFKNRELMAGLAKETDNLLQEIKVLLKHKLDNTIYEANNVEFDSYFESIADYYIQFVKYPNNMELVSKKSKERVDLTKNIWKYMSKFSDCLATNENKYTAFQNLKPFLTTYVKNVIEKREIVLTEENKILELQQYIQHIFEGFGISIDAQKMFKLKENTIMPLESAISGLAVAILKTTN